MPLIQRFLPENDTNPEAVSEILTAAGILQPRHSENKSELKEILRQNQLSTADCVRELSLQMCNATKEETKVKLLQTALQMNGAMKDDATKEAPQISFQIFGNVQLNSILAPQRD